MPTPLFISASPYAKDVLSLPVADLDTAVDYYAEKFGLAEVERRSEPCPAVIMERDGVQLGFAINGGDAAQEGASIAVSDITVARQELEARGVKTANWRVDERDGQKFQVFFVVAPDGLCYYFNQRIE